MSDQIVADTSAIVSVVFGEEDAETYADILDAHTGALRMSEVTRFELRVVVEAKRGARGVLRLDELLEDLRAAWVPVDAEITQGAIAAWREFGKGRHPARLNLGDCFSYALARHLDVPLLYKGDDFAQTDIGSVLAGHCQAAGDASRTAFPTLPSAPGHVVTDELTVEFRDDD